MEAMFLSNPTAHLISLLEQAVNPTYVANNAPSTAVANPTRAIEDFCRAVPDVMPQLVAVVTKTDGTVSIAARAVAGILLKNQMKKRGITDLKNEQLSLLIDFLDDTQAPTHTDPLLMRSISSAVATVGTMEASRICMGAQSSSLPRFNLHIELVRRLAERPRLAMGHVIALKLLLEEAAFDLLASQRESVDSVLLPQLLTWLSSTQSPFHHSPKTLAMLLQCIRPFIPTQHPYLAQNICSLLLCISRAHQCFPSGTGGLDELMVMECEMAAELMQGFEAEIEASQNIHAFECHLYTVLLDDFTVSPPSHEVALASGQFWLAEVEREGAAERMHTNWPVVERLLPLLLRRMRYDEVEDETELCKALEDLSVPDCENDLQPRHFKRQSIHKAAEDDHEDGELANDSDSESDSDSDPDNDATWSLRKCSAATLDGLALILDPERLVPLFLPAFYAAAESAMWLDQEAALLAFGAVAPGLWKVLAPHLPNIAPFLIRIILSQQQHPLVRAMAAWTASRLAQWIVFYAAYDDGRLFDGLVEALLIAMADRNKRLQHAATSAIAELVDAANNSDTERIAKHLSSLLASICVAVRCYQKRALFAVLELFRSLLEAFPSANENHSPSNVSAPLSKLTATEQDASYARSIIHHVYALALQPSTIDSSAIFPVIEVLMSALAGGHAAVLLAPLRLELLRLALALASHNIDALLTAAAELGGHADSTVDDGRADFLLVALDFLDAIVVASGDTDNGLGVGMEETVPFAAQLSHCLNWSLLYKDSSAVRQAAFALLGDLAKQRRPSWMSLLQQSNTLFASIHLACANCFRPSFSTASLDSISLAEASNAVWSIGELALNEASHRHLSLSSLATSLLSLLIPSDENGLPAGSRVYFENVTVTLGRILLVQPSIDLNAAIPWTRTLKLLASVDSEEERLSALTGYLGATNAHARAHASLIQPLLPEILRDIDDAGSQTRQHCLHLIRHTLHEP